MSLNIFRMPLCPVVLIVLLVLTSGVSEARNLWEEPQDTSMAISNPDLYAWQLFVALNWPADVKNRKADPKRPFGTNDYVVWESWKLSSGQNDEVFLKDGKDPGPWLAGPEKPKFQKLEDFETMPLQQVPRVLKGKMRLFFDPSTATRSRNENHMNQAAYEFIRANELYHVGGQEKFFYIGVDLRNKAREKLDNEGVLEPPHKYKKKLIDFPGAAKEVKAQWRPIQETEKSKYRWQEYIDRDGSKKLYGLTALHITTKDLPNWLWATFEHVDNPSREGAEPWIVPTNDSSAGPNGYPDGLGIQGTIWENYRLRGTQVDFVDATGKPTILSNSQIEEGFQTSSSCITCHGRATIGPRVGQAANRLSIFKEAFPSGDQTRVVGPVGPPEPGLFEVKTTDDDVIGKLTYLQVDFVWSLFRASRQPPPPGMALAAKYEKLSYAEDIRPLFRPKDINAMKRVFDLSSYDDVKKNAEAIYGRLSAGSMPCDGPWPEENVKLFKKWIDEGMKP